MCCAAQASTVSRNRRSASDGLDTPDFILLSKMSDPNLLLSEFFEAMVYFVKVFVCVKHKMPNNLKFDPITAQKQQYKVNF